ncbi:unnamed protein product [Clavelina lepadiformis]|uniref:Protein-PII uridylyltransferase N-terminal domain-containing protein n=1 Tax=Clavelina lepadiformis TaxID=159417 RepID=A0ABP0G3S4_CLALP
MLQKPNKVEGESLIQTELKLARDLRMLCDATGKEINPFMSAPILNEIGLIYRKRSPDKLNLIRSAVLLNAAVARQPSNAKFQTDIKEICSYLLQVAGTHKNKTDLVKISKQVKVKIQQMRKEAKEKLGMLTEIPYKITDDRFKKLAENKIEIVEGLQNMITEKYKSIMEYVSAECQNIMGTPPCRFNVTGMGSLARREITPYSDFEHIILLEEGVQHKSDYKKILEYFRWFSVIFHFIIINLQETIVPSVTVPSLNNSTNSEHNWLYDFYTTRGVSFDGFLVHACKFPLGRTEKTQKKPWTTELIKPVSEILKYLDFEVALKNGYHLNEVLKETCFVFGDRKLYDDFERGRFEVQNTDAVLYEFQRTKQLEDDLDNFSMDKLNNLFGASSCNIKRVVYRSFSSSFNVVRLLQKEGRINGDTASGLLFALAVACEVRLKVYMAKGRQDDCLDKGETFRDWVSDIRMQVIKIVGERSMVECMNVANQLQMFLGMLKSNQCQLLDTKLIIDSSFYSKLEAIMLLGCNDRVIKEWNDRHKKQLCANDYLNPYVCFYVVSAYILSGKYQEALQIFMCFENHPIQSNRNVNFTVMIQKATCLLRLGKCKEAVEQTNRAKREIASTDFADFFLIPTLYNIAGQAKCQLGFFHEALTEFRDYFKCPFHKTIPQNHLYTVHSLIYVGFCLMELGKLDSAMHKARQALELSKQIKSVCILKSYRLLSECYFRKEKYKGSLEYAEKALDGVNKIRDSSIAKQFEIEKIKALIKACKEKLGYDNTACA